MRGRRIERVARSARVDFDHRPTRHRRRRRDADAGHGARRTRTSRGTTPLGSPTSRRCHSKSTRCGPRGSRRRYLDHGWTSCVGRATAKPRLDVVVRNAINEGLIPGPRYLAASQEITVPGGLGDETLPHLPFPEFSFAVNVSGAEDMRRVCRMFLKYGVDAIKINLSGDNLDAAGDCQDELDDRCRGAGCGRRSQVRGKRVAAHARSCDSIKQAVRCGVRGDLPRQLHRQRGARPARGAQGHGVRRAGPVGDLQAAVRGRSVWRYRAQAPRDSATRRNSRPPSSR